MQSVAPAPQRAYHPLGREGSRQQSLILRRGQAREPQEVRRDLAQPQGQNDCWWDTRSLRDFPRQEPRTRRINTHALGAARGPGRHLQGILVSEMGIMNTGFPRSEQRTRTQGMRQWKPGGELGAEEGAVLESGHRPSGPGKQARGRTARDPQICQLCVK